jgi:hypothetical protein
VEAGAGETGAGDDSSGPSTDRMAPSMKKPLNISWKGYAFDALPKPKS